MTVEHFRGATAGDALLTGEHVALFEKSHLIFNGQRVEFPAGESFGVLYPVISRTGQKFVGQAHDLGNATMEYDGTQWHTHPPSNGTYGAAYDGQDNLQIIAPGPNVTSQGYRNIGPDGELVFGDETYAPNHGVSQWTDIGDGIIIGQGHEVNGAVVWDGSVLRRIDDPDDVRFCWPVRARRSGNYVVITYTRAGEGVIVWRGSVSELLALPLVHAPAPPPTPVPVPQPKPEPKPMSLPDPGAVKAALQRERAKFPERVNNDQCGLIVNGAAAQFAHCGMHRKTGGEFARLPNGETVNRNVMRYLPPGDEFGWWSDVLGAAGAGIASPQTPQWERSTDGRESFVPAIGGVEPEPDPGEPQPIPGTLEDRVAAIESWIRRAL